MRTSICFLPPLNNFFVPIERCLILDEHIQSAISTTRQNPNYYLFKCSPGLNLSMTRVGGVGIANGKEDGTPIYDLIHLVLYEVNRHVLGSNIINKYTSLTRFRTTKELV